MAFVNEYISDADRARIEFSSIKHPIHRYPLTPGHWTVDHELDVALICFGTGGESERASGWIYKNQTNIFVMYWQGQVVDVFLKKSLKGERDNYEVSWSLDSFHVPSGVSRETMLITLRNALLTYGSDGIVLRDSVKAIHFEF